MSEEENFKEIINKRFNEKMEKEKDKEVKKLQKIIEEQQNDIEGLRKEIWNLKENSISKDKIREKIKELKTKIIGSNTGIYSVQIDILNELLEE